jgi:hypothetical protein
MTTSRKQPSLPLSWYVIITTAAMMFGYIALGQPVPPIATTQPTTRPVGVWYQPAYSFDKWKTRGVNLLVGYEAEGGSTKLDAWCVAAASRGFNNILQDTALVGNTRGTTDPNCVAVLVTPDEPNGAGARTPGQMLDAEFALRSRTNKPICGNFDGWKMQYETDAELVAYFVGLDWILTDHYLACHGDSPNGDLSGLPSWCAQLDRVKRLAPGKKVFCFIECCDQRLDLQSWAQQPGPDGKPWKNRMHGPSVYEMQCQHDEARRRGFEIVWFADVFATTPNGTWSGFDGTTDLNAGAMQALNRQK